MSDDSTMSDERPAGSDPTESSGDGVPPRGSTRPIPSFLRRPSDPERALDLRTTDRPDPEAPPPPARPLVAPPRAARRDLTAPESGHGGASARPWRRPSVAELIESLELRDPPAATTEVPPEPFAPPPPPLPETPPAVMSAAETTSLPVEPIRWASPEPPVSPAVPLPAEEALSAVDTSDLSAEDGARTPSIDPSPTGRTRLPWRARFGRSGPPGAGASEPDEPPETALGADAALLIEPGPPSEPPLAHAAPPGAASFWSDDEEPGTPIEAARDASTLAAEPPAWLPDSSSAADGSATTGVPRFSTDAAEATSPRRSRFARVPGLGGLVRSPKEPAPEQPAEGPAAVPPAAPPEPPESRSPRTRPGRPGRLAVDGRVDQGAPPPYAPSPVGPLWGAPGSATPPARRSPTRREHTGPVTPPGPAAPPALGPGGAATPPFEAVPSAAAPAPTATGPNPVVTGSVSTASGPLASLTGPVPAMTGPVPTTTGAFRISTLTSAFTISSTPASRLAERELVIMVSALVVATRLAAGGFLWLAALAALACATLGALEVFGAEEPEASPGIPIEALILPGAATLAAIGALQLVPIGVPLLPAGIAAALIIWATIEIERRVLERPGGPSAEDRTVLLSILLFVAFLGFTGVAVAIPGAYLDPAAAVPVTTEELQFGSLFLLAAGNALVAGLLGYRLQALQSARLRGAIEAGVILAAIIAIATVFFRLVGLQRLLGPALLVLILYLWTALRARDREGRGRLVEVAVVAVVGIFVAIWAIAAAIVVAPV